ncbi:MULTISPECIES: aspartate/glutamate racemase family protein [unclassified Sinorhizobium]|uniref:aspartate/glutamate racemase family protein n=1 Tax=unclassified Sinorhizobium TaxID=2613772 RepID=UPI0024C458E9|nr:MULTISPECIES: aspartate/glutamate racemase family protein [unclassified Sinorhizobium]MDK1377342.1 aspartate/glutamate racemase family protein [Sinorhizobium sp. 6-70]MDK1480352.1 aspartate/glutamate racemase family protein [Sinorhizobium sp. 6-117]
MPSLALIHTVPDLVARFRPLVTRSLPAWTSFNIVDESLLANTVRDGVLSQQTIQRLGTYVFSAAEAGADAVVVTCSTLGGAVDLIRPLSSVPLFRIDQGMAVEAVERARRIGVLATLPTTLVPTSALLQDCARAAGKDCTIVPVLCEGAFERLSAGDREGHDARVMEGYRSVAETVDLVVLAQASMAAALADRADEPPVPFLTSPELGMAHVARQLASI